MVFSLLIASLAGAALAQIENTPDTLVYSLETGARFEDNRDATKDDKEDQLTFSVAPGIRFNLDDEVTRAFFMYRPSLQWRNNPRDDQNETELFHTAEVNVDHEVSSLFRLGGYNRFEMTDDPNVSQGGVTVRENASYWVNRTRGWTAYLLDERTQWDLDGDYMIKRYEENEFDDFDEDRVLVNTGLRYELEPEFTAFGFLGYDRPTYNGDTRGDYNGYLIGGGLTRKLNDQLSGTAALGYEFIDYEDAVEDSASMPYLRFSADYQHTKDLLVQGAAEYSMEPSDRSFYSSKEYLRLLLRGVYSLTPALAADAQVVYSVGYYDAESVVQDREDDVADTIGDGDDTLMDYQLGLSYRPPARRYYGRIAYEFEDWTSDVRESFSRNTVSATVGVEF